MPALHLEVATETHALALAPRMRAEDALEVETASNWTAEQALVASLEASSHAYALVESASGEVLALFGVQPLNLCTGVVWALTGTGVERHRAAFFRTSKRAVVALSETWPVLFNFTDARYTRALRWLKALGFQVLPAIPHGEAGLPFHPVVYRRA